MAPETSEGSPVCREKETIVIYEDVLRALQEHHVRYLVAGGLEVQNEET